MTYDPVAYWTEASTNAEHQDNEARFVHTPVFQTQEERLMATLETLEFDSILEVGCGWGRITKLVHERWPDKPYLATDMTAARVAAAQRNVEGVSFRVASILDVNPRQPYELVLAVETLMHVPPSDIEETVEKLCSLSSGYVVSLDWTEPIERPIAPHNFRHDYVTLYGDRLISKEKIGLQSIYVAKP